MEDNNNIENTLGDNMNEDREEKNNNKALQTSGFSITGNIQRYAEVSTERKSLDRSIGKAEKDMKINNKKSSRKAYENQPFYQLIWKGIRNKNFPLVKNGLKKVTHLPLSLTDILKAQYTEFIKSKDKLYDQIDDAQTDLDAIYKIISDNVGARKDLINRKYEIEKQLESYNKKKIDIEARKKALDRNDPNYEKLLVGIDQEYAAHLKNYGDLKAEFLEVTAKHDTYKESYDMLSIVYEEKTARLPHIKQMFIIADARAEQADHMIQSQAKSMSDAEATFQVIKSFGGLSYIMEQMTESMAIFNRTLPKMTEYISKKPLVDEKGLANLIESIKPLKIEAEKNFNLLTNGQVDEFWDMTLKDCYDTLGLEITADATQMEKAKRAMLMKYHPDKALDEKDKAEYGKITRKIKWAYDIVSSMDNLQGYSKSRTRLLS